MPRSASTFRAASVAALLALGLLVAGCGSSSSGDRSGKPVVAATAPQIDGMVRELAGPGVEVAAVVAATADVHELELRPSQVRALRDASLILRPGRGNDAWAQEALGSVNARQVDVAEGLPGDARHWWMDPVQAETAATRVAAELDRLDPAGKTRRATALAGMVDTLRQIDEQTKRCLASVPKQNRVIVTDHDAAGAYADRYGLTVAGTISPGSEPEAAPSAQRIVELEKAMKRDGVKAVFPIAPHGSALAKTVAERGGATLGEPLWADALPGAEHEHGAEDEHGADNEHAAEEDHAAESDHDLEAEPTLESAARLNGHSVALALGAKPAACGDLLR